MGGLGTLASAQDVTDLAGKPAADPLQSHNELPTVQVQGTRPDTRTYDRAEIDATPESNRDLTSLISSHPALRLNPSTSDNGNHGSLAPESFSIYGESPYQNQFLIDGISSTNAINPQVSATGLQAGRVPGYSQTYSIDTDMLERVEVHDSRVPVEFGHFQGGVVDARIKTPTGSNRFSIKQRFNSSNLTQQKMPEGALDDWNNGQPGYSSNWKKHFTSFDGDLRVTEDTSALISMSRRDSAIQRQTRVLDTSVPIPNGNASTLQMRDESDTVDNLFAKFHTRWSGDTKSSITFKYADRQEDLASSDFANTSWSNRQTAYGVALDLEQLLESGKLTAKIGFDQMDALRDSSSNEFTTQQFADKSLAQYVSGDFGTESLNQRQTTAKMRMDWNAFGTGSIRHKVYAGLDVQSTKASFERDEDAFATLQSLQTNGTQKITTRTQYLAGTAGVGYDTMGLYLSDSMQWGNLGWTMSARADHDNLFNNTNVTPRTRLDWDAFGDGRTQLGLGWARYYGLDMLGLALQQEKSKLIRYLVQRGVAVDKPAGEIYSYAGLQTPHSDEWALTFTQQISPFLEGGLSLVRRNSMDGVTQDGNATDGYFYTNDANAKTKSAAISLRTLKPWKAAAGEWNSRIDFSWQKTRRNHDSTLGWEGSGLAPDDIVEVDGVQTQRRNKPSAEFNQPYRLSVGMTGKWHQAGIAWSNRFNWNSSKTGVAYLGTTKGVERYGTVKLASYWTWDTSLTYQPSGIKGLTLSLDVLNALNVIRPIAIANPILANNIRYQTGREIWLSAGYAF